MKVTLLQTDIVWADPAANHQALEVLMDQHAGSDLYVLPEMFSTGFATEPKGIAETDGCSLRWMLTQAEKRGCAIAGSVATAEMNGKAKTEDELFDYYNRFYFVKPDGTFESYDKIHLFTYGGEHKRFRPGKERTIVEYQGVKFLLQICYDLRFPGASRNRLVPDEMTEEEWAANNFEVTNNTPEYDVALYVASWPTVRLGAWTALLHARAIENQCYVVGVDRTGDDPACSYSGGSEVVDPWGQTLVACERNKVDAVTAELDMDKLNAFREKFPVLSDRDDYKLSCYSNSDNYIISDFNG